MVHVSFVFYVVIMIVSLPTPDILTRSF